MRAGCVKTIDVIPRRGATDGALPALSNALSALRACATARHITVRPSRRGGTDPRPKELEQIVGEADDCPLALHVAHAAQPEAPKTARLFDLPKDRLGDRLAQGIQGAPGWRLQLRAHLLTHRVPAAACRLRARVLLPIRRDVAIHRGQLRGGEIGRAEVP